MNGIRRQKKPMAGFTLIEVLIAAILIGFAIASILSSTGSFTNANAIGINLSTAEFLIEEIRELTAAMTVVDPEDETTLWGKEADESTVSDFDDLDDFDDMTFNPPVDINCQQLTNFSSFTQQVVVQNVAPGSFETVVGDHASDFVRITVTILFNGTEIDSASWIRTRLD